MNEVWQQRALHAKAACGLLTPEECEIVKGDALALGMTRAKVHTREGSQANPIRTNEMARLPRTPEREWLYERLMTKGREINANYWRFALTGIDEIQVLRYKPMQQFKWHFDVAPGMDRKVTCVVALSSPRSYWRGGLEIRGRLEGKSESPQLGAATWFPTYLHHRGRAPWWGERWALVTWLTGPAWV
jgi:PKHD-type hydroxylase